MVQVDGKLQRCHPNHRQKHYPVIAKTSVCEHIDNHDIQLVTESQIAKPVAQPQMVPTLG